MKLTAYTDYTLRTLMYLAITRDRLITVRHIAELYDISKNNLMKVVHQLGLSGTIETVRGRNGGVRLNREPIDINIGQVVRGAEGDFFMAECFDPASNTCSQASACTLKDVLENATEAYLAVLDELTLADLIKNKDGCAAGLQTIRMPASTKNRKPA